MHCPYAERESVVPYRLISRAGGFVGYINGQPWSIFFGLPSMLYLASTQQTWLSVQLAPSTCARARLRPTRMHPHAFVTDAIRVSLRLPRQETSQRHYRRNIAFVLRPGHKSPPFCAPVTVRIAVARSCVRATDQVPVHRLGIRMPNSVRGQVNQLQARGVGELSDRAEHTAPLRWAYLPIDHFGESRTPASIFGARRSI